MDTAKILLNIKECYSLDSAKMRELTFQMFRRASLVLGSSVRKGLANRLRQMLNEDILKMHPQQLSIFYALDSRFRGNDNPERNRFLFQYRHQPLRINDVCQLGIWDTDRLRASSIWRNLIFVKGNDQAFRRKIPVLIVFRFRGGSLGKENIAAQPLLQFRLAIIGQRVQVIGAGEKELIQRQFAPGGKLIVERPRVMIRMRRAGGIAIDQKLKTD